MVKDRLHQDTIKLDRSLSRLQALLDVAGPLAMIVDLGERGELTVQKAVVAAKVGLRFVGNASVHTSRERRKRAIMEMNNKLTDLAKKDYL